MSKAILVIDMPDSCDKCPLLLRHDEERCCIPEKRNSFTTKPDWCPLKPIPEKFSDCEDIVKAQSDNAYEVGLCMYNRGTIQGYNSCIDRILKDKESAADEAVRNG